MVNWLLDDIWRKLSMPWLMPLPPNVFFSNNNSPSNSFLDYMNPVVDRLLLPSYGEGNLFNYNRVYPKQGSYISKPLVTANKMTSAFNREYRILNCLGTGGYGHVYNGRRRADNSAVVIKILPRNGILNWGKTNGKSVPYEIETLWRLQGIPGIIRIIDHFEEPDRFIFTMEKIPNSCTLFQFVMESLPLANTELLRHIFREIIRINVALQSYSVWHRDCKAENILYCKSDRSLHLIDFGSAVPALSDNFYEFQGTLQIMAPEWIIQRRYSGEAACVWSLGVCLYFLLFQQYPFRSKAEIVKGQLSMSPSSTTDRDAYQTMRQCLNVNEHRRPKLSTLQQLQWLQQSY